MQRADIVWNCHLSDGQIIIPIFINVEPKDVKYQIGSFQEPFEEHQRYREPAVNAWKNALTEVGKISGLVITLEGDAEPMEQLQRKLVERVLRELYRTPLDERRHIIGVESDVKEVIRLLHIDSDDVRFVGICGMGGLGKTTIAEVVRDEVSRKLFNRSCFLRDVNQEASKGNAGFISLQKQLLQDILKREYNISNVSEGESLISQNLGKKRRILLILDGVEEEQQLVALAGGLNWFGLGSKVIITTRDKHILNVHGKKIGEDIQIYVPKEMTHENALHLFSLHAFSKKEPPEDYRQLSYDVVHFAGRLPLVLEVLGSFLMDKNDEEWEETLERLKDIKNSIKTYDDKVFARLMMSYTKLGDPEKIIFLDIACNFSGYWQKKTLISIWEACELQPRLAIKELEQKHLLKIDGDHEYGTLRMHDQLRYMGRRIVLQGSSTDLTKRTRLWSQDDIFKVLRRNMGNQKMVEGIYIGPNLEFEGDDVLRYEDFEKMPNLRFLGIESHKLNGEFLRLPCALKWFCWNGKNDWENVPTNFYHEELVHLQLSKRCLELTWNDTPQNKRKRFQKLKVLILKDCRNLSVSANFLSWFPCLEHLDLSFSSSPSELPECICQVWPTLKTLRLHGCNSFNKLPTNIGELKDLVELSVSQTKIEEIPEGVGQLKKLEKLHVYRCKKIVKLPTSMSRMRSLRHFDLDGTMIAKLPDDFSKLSSLEVFRMPHSLSEVDQFTCYMGLQPVPINVSGFSQLQELCLSEYPMNLESLPELPLILTTLRVKFYHSLKMTPDLSHLERLKIFSVSSCKCLEYLGRLPSNLIYLSCDDCKSLVRLPDLSYLESLKEIEIEDCENLEEILGLDGMKSLISLKVMFCSKITEPRRKIFGQGKLRDDRGEGQGSESIIADDDENYNGSPILCVVFDPPPEDKEIDYFSVSISAFIRQGEKIIECDHWIRIEDIDLSIYYQDIIYIHHFKVFDWFGLQLESKDAIKELTAMIFCSSKDDDDCEIIPKYVKFLFENKESNQQMPDRQSSAMLVADFFIWYEDDDDDDINSSEKDDDQDDYKEDQDDYESGEDDQHTLDQPSHAQEKGKTSLEEEESMRPIKRARLHHNDEEASSSPSLFLTLTPYVEEYSNLFYPLGQQPNIGDDVQVFPSDTEEAERCNRTINFLSSFI